MAVDYKAIGVRIKYYRRKKRMSQEQLAEQDNLSSVHISYLECAERVPSLEAIINIANALGVSSDALLTGNLLYSNPSLETEIGELLFDCTSEELSIITRSLVFLRELLKEFKITE